MSNPMDYAGRKKVIITVLRRFHPHAPVHALYQLTFSNRKGEPDVEMSMRVSEPNMEFLKSMWELAGLEVITNE